jgi:hypothetical protein
MTKTIVLCLALLFASVSHASGIATDEPVKKEGSGKISTLIINADVTVVLVDYDNAQLEIIGKDFLKKFVTFRNSGDTLFIGAAKTRELRYAGVIYVPASQLKNIRINSKAMVRSMYFLQIPKLNVVINGACRISISNVGELNCIGINDFEVEQTTEVRQLPGGFLGNSKVNHLRTQPEF